MKQAILLVSWAGTIHLAKEMLQTSMKDFSRPIVVAVNEIEAVTDNETLSWLMENYQTLPIQGNRWEVGGLEAMLAFTDYDEWILIQDTLEIIESSIFTHMFNPQYMNKSVSFGPGWLCYLGKYRREILMQFPLPVCLTKMDAFYHEQMLARTYEAVAELVEGQKVKVLFPDWGNDNPQNTYDNKFNRKNIVLYNPFIIKRKALEWMGPVGTIATIEHL